jgi:lysozyme family protein
MVKLLVVYVTNATYLGAGRNLSRDFAPMSKAEAARISSEDFIAQPPVSIMKMISIAC